MNLVIQTKDKEKKLIKKDLADTCTKLEKAMSYLKAYKNKENNVGKYNTSR